MATHTHDDGFHEIQLNGKQLVFLFMAVTVVSVVIFLCGVLVGRGVRAERAVALGDSGSVAPSAVLETPRPQPAPVPAGSDPTAAAAPPSGGDLTYFSRTLEKSTPPERLKSPGEKAPSAASVVKSPSSDAGVPAEPTAGKSEPRPQTASATPKTAEKAAGVAQSESAAEPAGAGFALQVTALREQSEAEAVARRLSAKGYAVYVLKPTAGSPPVYRVRVGKFKTRREAEAIAAKLQKEEQFTPWITR